MEKKKNKKEVVEAINNLFLQASKSADENPELSKKYIIMAKKIAMRSSAKLGKLRQKYCGKCYSYFNSKNSNVRIKNGTKTIKCLNCGRINRIKIK